MSPTNHLYDNDIKKEIKYPIGVSEFIDSKILENYKPDLCAKIGETIKCIEYENSSRGMIVHVAKYSLLAHKNPNTSYSILIIESKYHQQHHLQDRTLSKFLVDTFCPQIINLHIKIERCDSSMSTLQQTVSNFFSTQSA